jgi:hypothetical protein
MTGTDRGVDDTITVSVRSSVVIGSDPSPFNFERVMATVSPVATPGAIVFGSFLPCQIGASYMLLIRVLPVFCSLSLFLVRCILADPPQGQLLRTRLRARPFSYADSDRSQSGPGPGSVLAGHGSAIGSKVIVAFRFVSGESVRSD